MLEFIEDAGVVEAKAAKAAGKGPIQPGRTIEVNHMRELEEGKTSAESVLAGYSDSDPERPKGKDEEFKQIKIRELQSLVFELGAFEAAPIAKILKSRNDDFVIKTHGREGGREEVRVKLGSHYFVYKPGGKGSCMIKIYDINQMQGDELGKNLGEPIFEMDVGRKGEIQDFANDILPFTYRSFYSATLAPSSRSDDVLDTSKILKVLKDAHALREDLMSLALGKYVDPQLFREHMANSLQSVNEPTPDMLTDLKGWLEEASSHRTSTMFGRNKDKRAAEDHLIGEIGSILSADEYYKIHRYHPPIRRGLGNQPLSSSFRKILDLDRYAEKNCPGKYSTKLSEIVRRYNLLGRAAQIAPSPEEAPSERHPDANDDDDYSIMPTKNQPPEHNLRVSTTANKMLEFIEDAGVVEAKAAKAAGKGPIQPGTTPTMFFRSLFKAKKSSEERQNEDFFDEHVNVRNHLILMDYNAQSESEIPADTEYLDLDYVKFEIAPQMALLFSSDPNNLYAVAVKIGDLVARINDEQEVELLTFTDYFKEQRFVMKGLESPDKATLNTLKNIILDGKFDNSFELVKRIIGETTKYEDLEALIHLLNCLQDGKFKTFEGEGENIDKFYQLNHYAEVFGEMMSMQRLKVLKIIDRLFRIKGGTIGSNETLFFSDPREVSREDYPEIDNGVYLLPDQNDEVQPMQLCCIPIESEDKLLEIKREPPNRSSVVKELLKENYFPDQPDQHLTKSAMKR